MHYWLKSFLVAALFTWLGAEAQQVNNAGNSEVKVVGYYNTISRVDGSQKFFMVVDEYEGGDLSRQNICSAGDGFQQPFDPETIFKCESTGRTRIVFQPDGSFGAFTQILGYARRVFARGREIDPQGEHTFDLQFRRFGSLNNHIFYLRRVKNEQTGRWSRPIGVGASDYACEAYEQTIRCLWTPQDRGKETITWVDYGPEFTED